MFYRTHSKHMLGVLVGGLALATWGLLGIFGTASALAGKPPPPADPAIAYAEGGHGWYLDVCNLDGTNANRVAPLGGQPVYLTWSPDGRSIGFAVTQGGSWNGIWRIDVSVVNGAVVGRSLVQLVSQGGINGIDWSPLGDSIVYEWNLALWTIPATGGTPQQIYSGYSPLPRWSPDASRIVFTDASGPALFNIKVLDVATGITTTVITVADQPIHIDWSNTSDLVGFIDAHNHLNLLDVGTGALAIYTQTVANVSFMPDDTRIVFSTGTKRNLATFRLSDGATTTLPPTNVYAAEARRNP